MGGIVGLRDVLVVAPAASFHHQHQHQHQESLYSTAAAVTEHPIIPLLTSAPCLMGDDSRGKSINLWQQHHHHHHPPPQNPNPNIPYLKKPMPMSMPMLDPASILSAGSGTTTCQDCGNQAKKDCSHNRCRTCCKSRGFDCTTHVKSTWVPAARRRERQLSVPGTGHGATAGSSASTSAPKKPRLLSSQTTTSHTSTSNNTTRSYDTSSSHRDAESLPGHVRAPAVFKCVRVSSVDEEGEDEYAYQAMVTIRGHVFKGFLYDHGVDDGREEHTTITAGAAVDDNNNNDNNNNSAIRNLSELHLGGRSGTSSSAAMVTSDIYGGGGGLLGVGGTAYGNPIN